MLHIRNSFSAIMWSLAISRKNLRFEPTTETDVDPDGTVSVEESEGIGAGAGVGVAIATSIAADITAAASEANFSTAVVVGSITEMVDTIRPDDSDAAIDGDSGISVTFGVTVEDDSDSIFFKFVLKTVPDSDADALVDANENDSDIAATFGGVVGDDD